MTDGRVALVIGAGDATGGAIARRFAREGYAAVITRRARHIDQLEALAERIRTDGGTAHPFGVDARKEDEMAPFIERVEHDIGPIEVAVYNVGGNVSFPIAETTARVFYKVWEMGCFGGFLMGREVARHMVPRKAGTILFTGATASLRGGAGFAAFAGAKHGLRALAQSMARELGPEGIHVAHVVIDGGIHGERLLSRVPELADERGPDGLLGIAAIAETFWQLHAQPRSAWTFETELRPYKEPF